MNFLHYLGYRLDDFRFRKVRRQQQLNAELIRKNKMDDLEAKIKAGQDKFAGVVDVPLTPIPEEYTQPKTEQLEPSAAEIGHVVAEKIIMSITDEAEQQAREALIRDSVDRYKIVRDALENCLAQAQHMRGDPNTAVEALRQIEMLAVAALAQS